METTTNTNSPFTLGLCGMAQSWKDSIATGSYPRTWADVNEPKCLNPLEPERVGNLRCAQMCAECRELSATNAARYSRKAY